MEKDTTQIITEFRNSSAKTFKALFSDFKASVKKLDRQTDENVFQQLQGRYVNELENQLKQLAKKVLAEHYGHETFSLLQKELTSHISYNVSEFVVKARSM